MTHAYYESLQTTTDHLQINELVDCDCRVNLPEATGYKGGFGQPHAATCSHFLYVPTVFRVCGVLPCRRSIPLKPMLSTPVQCCPLISKRHMCGSCSRNLQDFKSNLTSCTTHCLDDDKCHRFFVSPLSLPFSTSKYDAQADCISARSVTSLTQLLSR